MKFKFLFIILTLHLHIYGQDYKVQNGLPDCEQLTFISISKVMNDISFSNSDSLNTIMLTWVAQCGVSELVQRIMILRAIGDQKSSESLIATYFENEFHNVIKNRILDSKKINYGYIYSDAKAYFGFVPLRHPIDTILAEVAKNLLKEKNLAPDEKLVCLLFSLDTENYVNELNKKEYKNGFIKKYLQSEIRNSNNNWLGINFYTGMFRPIRSDNIFFNSPMFGLTFSSPMSNKLIIELGLKVRINIQDSSFYYTAFGSNNLVNSGNSIFGGLMASYKIFENQRLIVLPKFGIGVEVVDTGLSEQKKNSQDETYYNVETLHLSLGISALTPVFKRSYFGIGINYHYCPYQWDKNLLTKFENHLLSAELIYRF